MHRYNMFLSHHLLKYLLCMNMALVYNFLTPLIFSRIYLH